MRTLFRLALLCSVAACEGGSFTLTEALGGDPSGATAPDASPPTTQPDVDVMEDTGLDTHTDAPPALEPTPCGPDTAPAAEDLTGERLAVRSGNTFVSQSPPLIGPFRWEGCEVERRYDAAGQLRCERVYTVTGDQDTAASSGNSFVYQIERELDLAATTCPSPGGDERRRYRVQTQSNGRFSLEQAPPRTGRFSAFGQGTSQVSFGGFTLNYQTTLEAW